MSEQKKDKIGDPLAEAATTGVIGRRPSFAQPQAQTRPAPARPDPDGEQEEQKALRVKRTLMFTPQRAKWLKVQAAQEGREMSEIIEEALATYQQLHP